MANNDTSSYILRWNEILGDLEYSAGLNWISTGVMAGGGITQLTGDVTAGPGSGSQASTLATVNPDVGSFTNANITVNAKGLITAATNGSGGGVSSFAKSGDTPITGDVTISEGANVTLTEVGQDVQIAVPAAGSSGQIQYNSSNAFAASAALTWDLNNLVLSTGAGNAHLQLLTSSGVPFITLQTTSPTQVFSTEIESNSVIMETNNMPMTMNDLNDDGAGHGSCLLLLRSNTRGFRAPALATPSASISSPIEGTLAYDTTNHVYTYYNGTTWKVIATV